MLKIFIAEDDEVIRGGLKKIIHRYTPHNLIAGEAADGGEALDGILKTAPDLLITDIKMPVLDGVGLIRQLKTLGVKIKIIVLSGFDEYIYIRETFKNGVEDYLLKPIDKHALADLIHKVEADLEKEQRLEEESTQERENLNHGFTALKEKLLRELISGDEEAAAVHVKQFKELDIAHEKLFAVITAGVEAKSKKSADDKGQSGILLRQLLDHKRISSRSISQWLAAEHEKCLVVLLASRQEDEPVFEEDIHKLLQTFSDDINRCFDSTASFGVSKIFRDPCKTHAACSEALKAFNRRFYEGEGRIIPYNPPDPIYGICDEKELEPYFTDMMTGIELGQYVKVKKALEDIFRHLNQRTIDPEAYKQVLITMIRKIHILAPDIKDICKSFNNRELDLENNISEAADLSKLTEYLIRTFALIIELMNKERAEKSKRSIEVAKEYIRKHYAEEITLKSVAEYVNLNHCYFSELFKSETGENFSDFVMKFRMNTAKKLLCKHELKVYEIAEAVGYEDPTSFNRVFKRLVGISPAEYRKIIK